MQDLTKVKPLDKDKVRPFDTVTIEFYGSAYHKDGATDDVHPLLAEKLIKAGKAYALGTYKGPKKAKEDKE